MKFSAKILIVGVFSFWVQNVLSNPKISEYAVSPMDQKNYPRVYQSWGVSGVKKINSLMRSAAEKAAESPQCDKVDIVAFSEGRSIPKSKIVFFVDCINGKRFYIEDTDLKNNQTAKSQNEIMGKISDDFAINSCEKEVRRNLYNPMTFKRKFGTTSVYRAPTTANIVVKFEFSAKNNLGAELPSSAQCTIDSKNIEAIIKNEN